ncbi:MAG: hypothetical protein K2X69_01860 [Silvanigrellaceae bacterium]|nr:hypothetical protein [Silvanigrellaceae bacterium]
MSEHIDLIKELDILNIIKVVDYEGYNEIRIFYYGKEDKIINFNNSKDLKNFKLKLENILSNVNLCN